LCTFAAAALLMSCGKPKQASRSMLTVQTATIADSTFEPNIQAISMLESTTTVALMPETDGRVVQVLARDGEQVKAG
jgi:multidrug efflux pump subunit AcrA (membrane-fusion protein)